MWFALNVFDKFPFLILWGSTKFLFYFHEVPRDRFWNRKVHGSRKFLKYWFTQYNKKNFSNTETSDSKYHHHHHHHPGALTAWFNLTPFTLSFSVCLSVCICLSLSLPIHLHRLSPLVIPLEGIHCPYEAEGVKFLQVDRKQCVYVFNIPLKKRCYCVRLYLPSSFIRLRQFISWKLSSFTAAVVWGFVSRILDTSKNY